LTAFYLVWGGLHIIRIFQHQWKIPGIKGPQLKKELSKDACRPGVNDSRNLLFSADNKFCPSCGNPILSDITNCNICGARIIKYRRKSKTTAVLLAVFLGFWAWLYLYRKNVLKFWLNFILSTITSGIWGIVAWIWAIIDIARRPTQWYETYYQSLETTIEIPLNDWEGKSTTHSGGKSKITPTEKNVDIPSKTNLVVEKEVAIQDTIQNLISCIKVPDSTKDDTGGVTNTYTQEEIPPIIESTFSASFKERIYFVRDIFILTCPLWCPGNSSILRNEGIIDVFYSPGSRARNLDRFLRPVMKFSARSIDRLFQLHGIERINVWGMGRVRSAKEGGKSVWLILNLTFDNRLLQPYSPGYLPSLLSTDPQQYLRLCSARWVKEDQCPPWIPIGGISASTPYG
jgi:hypothetical protein